MSSIEFFILNGTMINLGTVAGIRDFEPDNPDYDDSPDHEHTGAAPMIFVGVEVALRCTYGEYRALRKAFKRYLGEED